VTLIAPTLMFMQTYSPLAAVIPAQMMLTAHQLKLLDGGGWR